MSKEIIVYFLIAGFILFNSGGVRAQEDSIGQEVLSLEDCISIALKNHSALTISQQKQIEAEEKFKEEKSKLFPRLDVKATYDRLDYLPKSKEYYIGHSYDDYQGYVEGSYEIFNLKNWLKKDVAGKSIDIEKQEFRATRQNVIFNVAKAYYSLAYAINLVEVKEKAVKRMEAYLSLAETRYKVGKAGKIDVLRAGVQLSDIRQGFIKAKNNLKLAKMRLNDAMGMDINKEIGINDVLNFAGDKTGVSEYIKEAFRNNPQWQELAISIARAQKEIGAEQADFLPKIKAYAYSGYEWSEEFPPEEDRYGAGVKASMPIWDFGEIKSRVNQEKAKLAQIKAQKILLEREIVLQVNTTFFNMENASERVSYAQKALKQAEESFEIAKIEYKKGIGSSTAVLDTQLDLLQAENNYIEALVDYNISKAGLMLAIGRESY